MLLYRICVVLMQINCTGSDFIRQILSDFAWPERVWFVVFLLAKALRRKEHKGEMYLLLHETISFHDLFFVGLAALQDYISEAFPGSQAMHSQ